MRTFTLVFIFINFIFLCFYTRAGANSRSFVVIENNEMTSGGGCTPKWGPDSLETLRKVSLYSEFFKQDNYQDAISHWRYVFFNAPGARQSTFLDGAKMYKEFADKAKDEKTKSLMVDTLLMIYDKRMECFGKTGELLGRKGIEMLSYSRDPKKTYNTLSESVEMDGKNSRYFILYPYIISAVKAEEEGIIDESALLEIYSKVSTIIDANVSKGGKYADNFKETQEQIDEVISKTGILNCDNLKPILQKQYEADKNDKDTWKKIYSQMKAARCATDPLFVEVTEKLFQTEPDGEKARILAMVYSNQGNYSSSLKYYEQALEMEKETDKLADYSLSIAKIYMDMEDFESARTYALKAASYRSGWGEPYLLIGDLYRGSGKKCGSGTGFESQVVTWPAIDMYEKAKDVDPSVASKANKKIEDSRQYMPSQAECFFRSLKEGDTYTVNCWINEKTTVRFGPEQ